MEIDLLRDNIQKENKVIRSFFSDPENKRIYEKVIESNREDLLEELNKRFREFFLEVRLIKFISTIIHNTVIELDIQARKKAQFLDPYDSALHDKLSTQEALGDKKVLFDDEVISKAFQSLTNNEKKVITLAFVKELKESEIAKRLNVTQQAVSKTKHRALKKLRETIRKGER
ncbi:hypothetical protein BBO01nite_44320 [Brevibacillus borstelensis]|nr:hypothetical protein BBO01nite_44320 [Brevibacillus borstelensis]